MMQQYCYREKLDTGHSKGLKVYIYPFDHDCINSECKVYTTFYNSQRLKHLYSNPQLSLHPVDLTIWLTITTIFPQWNQKRGNLSSRHLYHLSLLSGFICQIMTWRHYAESWQCWEALLPFFPPPSLVP